MTNRITSVVDIDVNKAIAALKNVEKGLDGTESSAERAALAMEAMADVIAAESVSAANAVEKMSTALGSEFVADLERAGGSVDELVASLNRAGVAYDDVAANADRLAGSVKKVDTASRGTSVSIDGVTRSGDQSRSVLANMVGNSAQDIGALSGVAGTAGVAIGQLAEYAADGNIQLANMGKLGAGVAGIGIALWAVEKSAKQSAANIKALAEEVGNLSTVTDAQVVDAFVQSLSLGFVEGQSFQDVITQMAEENLPGLKRALDLGIESGRLNAETQAMMAEAIYEAERAAAQGAATADRYGAAMSTAAADLRALVDATGDVEKLVHVWDAHADGTRQTGQAVSILRGQLAEYRGDLEGIPDEEFTRIETALDRGDIATAEELLRNLTRTRTVDVKVRIAFGKPNERGKGAAAGSGAKATGPGYDPQGILNDMFSDSGSGGGGGGGGGGGSSIVKEESDGWDEAMARAYEYGEVARAEYRKFLEARMAGEEKYSDEYHKYWALIQGLDKATEDERARTAKEREDAAKKAADEAEKLAKKAADEQEKRLEREAELAAIMEGARRAALEAFSGTRGITIYANSPTETINLIKQYERSNGTGWRSS